MGKKRMIIIGTGEYADRVQGYARTLITCEVIRFSKYQIYGTPECYTDYIATNTFFVVAFEDNKERLQWIEKLEEAGASLATIIHPQAYVSPSATIEPGSIILAYACINANTVVKKGCIVNIGCSVECNCILEKGVLLRDCCTIHERSRVKPLATIERGYKVAQIPKMIIK